MKTSPRPQIISQRESPPAAPTMGCPLQQAMEEIAQAAVRQHVLYQEGESQPRPELMARLEAWSSLHQLIRSRICTASRESRIPISDLDFALDELCPQLGDMATPSRLQRLRASLVACAEATSCPLGAKVAE